MANMAPAPYWWANAQNGYDWFNDFMNELDATNEFVVTLTDTGSAAVGTTPGGVVAIVPSDGTVADNDEAYIGMLNNVFNMAANKDIVFSARAQFSEANTDDANIILGLTSSVAADLLADNGGGVRASGTSFVIYKVDGGTVWRCTSRSNSVVTDSVSTTTAGGTNYFTVAVELHEITTTNATVTFWVNGELLRDGTNQPIRHSVAYSGATALTPCAGVKNGSANLETLNVDYIGVTQARSQTTT
jgi:hypothetical protein